ncbi:MAG: DUF5615 family PIN-like protein [Jatrophihabitans sp.]
MKLLFDEMYGARLSDALREVGIEATTVAERRLTGTPDAEVFAAALAIKHALLTENVSDFTRLAAERSGAGGHHSGLLIALSSRFSRRPAGTGPLVAAIQAVTDEQLDDRVVYLARQD